VTTLPRTCDTTTFGIRFIALACSSERFGQRRENTSHVVAVQFSREIHRFGRRRSPSGVRNGDLRARTGGWLAIAVTPISVDAKSSRKRSPHMISPGSTSDDPAHSLIMITVRSAGWT
jgi:hypothetical protein